MEGGRGEGELGEVRHRLFAYTYKYTHTKHTYQTDRQTDRHHTLTPVLSHSLSVLNAPIANSSPSRHIVCRLLATLKHRQHNTHNETTSVASHPFCCDLQDCYNMCVFCNTTAVFYDTVISSNLVMQMSSLIPRLSHTRTSNEMLGGAWEHG